MVEPTLLKNSSQNGNLPQVGVKIKNIWNPHLVTVDRVDLDNFGDFGATERVRSLEKPTFCSLRLPEKRRLAAWSTWPIAFGNWGKLIYLDDGDLNEQIASKLRVSSLVTWKLKIVMSISPFLEKLHNLLGRKHLMTFLSWTPGSR